MKAVVSQTLESTWANAINLRLEADLDNPHSLTTKEIASLMIHTIRTFVEEIRAENERHIFSRLPNKESREEAERRGQSDEDTASGRERHRYEEMMRSRETREGEPTDR